MFSDQGQPSEYYADGNETIFLFSNAYGAQIDEDYSTTEVQLEENQSDQILNQRQGIQPSKFSLLWKKMSQKFLRKICSKCISMVILTNRDQNSRKTVRPNKTRYLNHWCLKRSTDVGLGVSRSIISWDYEFYLVWLTMKVISMCTLFFIIICTWGSLKHSAQKNKNRELLANMTTGSESIQGVLC